MKPAAPDSPVFKALSSLTRDELENEVQVAERLLTAAQTYLAWVTLTLQATAAFEHVNSGPRQPKRKTRADMRDSGQQLFEDGITSNGTRPPLRRAILMILSEDPRRWRKRELYAELKRRGWLPEGKTPDKQLTNRLTEMGRRGEVTRHERGIYSVTSSRSTQGNGLGDRRSVEAG